MKALIIIIGVLIVGFIAVCYFNNRDAETKLHPDGQDPHVWYDDQGNQYIK